MYVQQLKIPINYFVSIKSKMILFGKRIIVYYKLGIVELKELWPEIIRLVGKMEIFVLTREVFLLFEIFCFLSEV